MDEPPALEDGSSFGRPRHKTGMSEDDPHNLEERYYRYGIKPEWMQIHRIVTHELVLLYSLFTLIFLRDKFVYVKMLQLASVDTCQS